MRSQPCLFGFSILLLLTTLAAAAEPIPRSVAQWSPKLGTHRAVVKLDGKSDQKSDVVRVHLPWRRPDRDPEKKAVFLVDAKTGKQLDNVVPIAINREYGDLVFQPITVPGTYYVYYLPAPPMRTGNRRSTAYAKPSQTADPAWRARNGLTDSDLPKDRWRTLPEARVTEFQALSEFDQFDEMERIATRAETDKLLARHPNAPYLLFPESRRHPIRMTDDLPQCWIVRGPGSAVGAKVQPGEFFAWQIGLFAARQAIDDVTIKFTDLRSTSDPSKSISASAIRCFNQGGVDWKGQRFTRPVTIEKGKVGALWFGVAIPKDLPTGHYKGTLTITPKGMTSSKVVICLSPSRKVLDDAGDSEPWRHSRLRWLDSTIALDDEPVAPYAPLEVHDNTIRFLGRRVTLGRDGLPLSIESYFAPEVTHLSKKPRELLASPVRFVAELADGTTATFSDGTLEFTQKEPGRVAWRSTSTSTADNLTLHCDAHMEPEGYIEYRLQLTAAEPVEVKVKDLKLVIPMRRDVARYMMGLGRPGGFRPSQHEWKWDRAKHQDCVWLGDVNAGLQCRWFGENYVRPFVCIHYAEQPLNLPPAWYNDGRGSVTITEPSEAGKQDQQSDQPVVLSAQSGPRTVKPGEPLHFNFTLLLTPFKPIDTADHWNERYYHRYRWPRHADEDLKPIADGGATVLNLHHGNGMNPYINYPFFTVKPLKKLIDRAHELGIRVKLYYTVREITTHLPELWAFRSFGDELLADGTGGGAPWLCEHVVHDYHPAWYDAPVYDASIQTAGMSRLHNFYLEGLDWLVRNVGIDGLYLDEIAYDRTVMKRARKILKRAQPNSLIDLHSWNHFCPLAGFACCANVYMESLPYVDRLVIGESRDYNGTPPDYWLVEISGIPFGLTNDMLQSGGNPWRGMVYGMTNRWGWGGDPRAIWKVWDAFGIKTSRMIGYWSPACPVVSDQKDVLATVYQKPGKAMIALASWSPKQTDVHLKIDWKALGLKPSESQLRAPAIKDFQPEMIFTPDAAIPLAPARGWLLILEPKKLPKPKLRR